MVAENKNTEVESEFQFLEVMPGYLVKALRHIKDNLNVVPPNDRPGIGLYC